MSGEPLLCRKLMRNSLTSVRGMAKGRGAGSFSRARGFGRHGWLTKDVCVEDEGAFDSSAELVVEHAQSRTR